MTQDLSGWIGRERRMVEKLDESPARRLAATFDMDAVPAPAGELPSGWQWLHFLPDARQSALGPDGHPARGGFMPPIDLPRRMFAGGSARYHAGLRFGVETSMTETIDSVKEKDGRTGRLAFVETTRRFAQGGRDCVIETQTVVYREAAKPGDPAPAPQPAPQDAAFKREWHPDPALLFRFSALTFNTHRIHYDRDYCRQEEGYPGLVVHGPLIAFSLLEAACEAAGRRASAFSFRAMSPLFDGAPFHACGRMEGDKASLWAEGTRGVAMQGEATF